MEIRRLRRLGVVTALLALATVAGCGTRGPKIVKVYGTVTRGGQPVKDLTVHFVPERGRPSWGFTDPQGRYTLHYSRDVDGAVVGRHRVFVKYEPHDPQTQYAIFQGRFEYPPDLKAIEEKYGNPETTPLVFELQDSQEINLKLD